MSVSDRKIEANRRNASKSTGPRTKAGKKRSRWNSFKHGLTAKKILLAKGESRKEFRKLLRGLRKDLKPKGTLQKIMVQQIAACQVQDQRGCRALRNAFQAAADEAREDFIDDDGGEWREAEKNAQGRDWVRLPETADALTRYQTTNDRRFDRILARFMKLKTFEKKKKSGRRRAGHAK